MSWPAGEVSIQEQQARRAAKEILCIFKDYGNIRRSSVKSYWIAGKKGADE